MDELSSCEKRVLAIYTVCGNSTTVEELLQATSMNGTYARKMIESLRNKGYLSEDELDEKG